MRRAALYTISIAADFQARRNSSHLRGRYSPTSARLRQGALYELSLRLLYPNGGSNRRGPVFLAVDRVRLPETILKEAG